MKPSRFHRPRSGDETADKVNKKVKKIRTENQSGRLELAWNLFETLRVCLQVQKGKNQSPQGPENHNEELNECCFNTQQVLITITDISESRLTHFRYLVSVRAGVRV